MPTLVPAVVVEIKAPCVTEIRSSAARRIGKDSMSLIPVASFSVSIENYSLLPISVEVESYNIHKNLDSISDWRRYSSMEKFRFGWPVQQATSEKYARASIMDHKAGLPRYLVRRTQKATLPR